MKQHTSSLFIVACLLCPSCHPRKDRQTTFEKTKKERPSPTYDKEKINSVLQKQFPEAKKYLSSTFFKELNFFLKNSQDKNFQNLLSQQLYESPKNFPIFPSLNISLHCTSPYDEYLFDYFIKAPKNISKEKKEVLFILLGFPLSYSEKIKPIDAWFINIPSRPLMNYQLLAEGDFWRMLEVCYSLYPHLRSTPTFLIGNEEASDASLLLANNYRSFFSGVAFNNSRLGMNLKNLDELPVLYFKQEKGNPSPSPWGNERLIKRLQDRNNPNAASYEGDIGEAFQRFLNKEFSHSQSSSFQFEDYQYAKAYPWLKVTKKKSEKDPVNVSIKIEKETFIVNGKNVKEIELIKAKEFNIKKVLFNNDPFSLSENFQENSICIPPKNYNSPLRKKTDAPGGFINFFRNEPLYILYQNDEKDKKYLLEAKKLAKYFSQLNFFGFPPLNIRLPITPITEYSPENLPEHRIIAIGKMEGIKTLVGNSKDLFPFKKTPEGLKVGDKIIPLDDSSFEKIAFSLCYPSEKNSSQKLAFLLVAEDVEGLKTLSNRYTSATSLYNEADLSIWIKNKETYEPLQEHIFNSAWEETEPSYLFLQIPQQGNEIWEHCLRELIIEESQIEKLAITPCIDDSAKIPERLSYESVSQTIADKHFAEITLKKSYGNKIGNKLLAAMDNPILHGLDDFLSLEFFSGKPTYSFKSIQKEEELTFIIDASALEVLSPQELQLTRYRILPYSLHEMLFYQLAFKKEKFGKKLLHLANSLE